MRRRTLLSLAALSSLTVMGADSPADVASPSSNIERAHVAARVVEHLTAEMSSALVDSVFRRVEGPNADLCRVDLRLENGTTTHTTWLDLAPRRWANTSRRSETDGTTYWMTAVVSFDVKGRPTRVVNEKADGRHPPKTQVVQRLVWFDEGAVIVSRRSLGVGLHEEYIIDEEQPNLVRVFRSWDGEPLVEHHTIEIEANHMRMRLRESPDVFIAFTWREDGSIDYVSSRGQSEAILTHYGPDGVMSNTPTWDIEVDDAGRPSVADSGGKHDAHFSYGCGWPEDAPTPKTR